MSRYALSDIHGCLTTFQYLVEAEIKLRKEDTLYLLGDSIDRGPDSKGVLDYIMVLQDQGYQVKALRGNHEDMMLKARSDLTFRNVWLRNGGDATLHSFGITTIDGIPKKYWDFLSQLAFYFNLKDYLLVHAGFNFALPDLFEDKEAMLWVRDMQVNKSRLGNKKLVHGHTPLSVTDMQANLAQENPEIINIDGGCVFQGRYGYLVCLDLDTLQLHKVANRET